MGDDTRIIVPDGGYQNLKAFQIAEIVYNGAVKYCDHFIDIKSRMHDQMVQAARSGKQNIAVGSMASGTPKKVELKLTGIARASLEELLLDYKDFLRQRQLQLWNKGGLQAVKIRKIGSATDRSYMSFKNYIEDSSDEIAANTLICIIHQTNYLLDQLLRQLEQNFLKDGGFTERLFNARSNSRRKK